MSEGNPTATVGGEGWQLATAPDFVLPGTTGENPSVYRLRDYTDDGCVILGFYPEERLGDSAFLDWFEFDDSIDAFVVSDISVPETTASRTDGGICAPILGDENGSVALEYGAGYEDSRGTVVLVDSNELIRATWTDDIDAADIYTTARQHMRDTETDTGGEP